MSKKYLTQSILVLFGDLNYRINLSYEEAMNLIKENNINELIQNDQLYIQRSKKKCFLEVEESDIEFLPTYRFDQGTSDYDTSEKKRIPSFCDRIFYKKSDDVIVKNYKSYMDYKTSDHKPISSLFDINSRIIDPKKYFQIKKEEMIKLNDILKDDNDFLMKKVAFDNIDDNENFIIKLIDFDHEKYEKIITIENTGLFFC
jgi:hypothetical protein